MKEQSPNDPPPETPPIVDYGLKNYDRPPGDHKSRTEYVLWVFGGLGAVIVAAVLGTVAAIQFNGAAWLILFLFGAALSIATMVVAFILKKRGCLLGVILGVVLIGLLLLGCGIIISQIDFR